MFDSRFDFKGTELRVHIGQDKREIFHGADTCKALGKERNHSRLIRTYVFPEYIIEVPNPNGGNPVLCLYEPGVYQLALNPIFDSEKARIFQRWIFEEVLPKLRASGVVMTANATSEAVAAEWEAQGKKIEELQQQLLIMSKEKQLKAASELEAAIASGNVAFVEYELLLRGTRLSQVQRQAIVSGTYLGK